MTELWGDPTQENDELPYPGETAILESLYGRLYDTDVGEHHN